MKSILSILLLCFVIFLQAQLSIATNFREDGTYNEAAIQWKVNQDETSLSLFKFNMDLTSFSLINKEAKEEIYTIIDWTYDEEQFLYDMKLKDKNGKEFEFIIDAANELVIFFYYNSSNEYCMHRYYILDSWFNEAE